MKKILVFLALLLASPAFCQSSPITIKYYGTFDLKIVSRAGQGAMLLGLSDSIDNSSPRTCIIDAQRNKNLILDLVVCEGTKQFVWPRARICKLITGDSVEITDADIEMLALYETVKTKVKLKAPGYQLSVNGSHISSQKSMPLPIGKSYLQLAYKNARGLMFFKVFLPVDVSEAGGDILVTADNLAKAVTIKNW